MAHESTGAHSCLSHFSRKSRRSALPPGASSNVSTYVRSWTALLIGVALLGVTFFVLFEDVLMGGAKVTTDHVLTLAVLLIVAAAGHMWWQHARNWHVFGAAGLVIVFVAGLVYLVVASGGRNAEVAANKRHAAHASNTERVDRLRKIAEAEYILASCPPSAPKKDYGERCGLRDAMSAECGSGKGKRCDGKSYSVSTYEAAVEGHRMALKGLPEQEENGALKSTARVLVAFYDVPTDQRGATEKRYVERLELVIPYVKALLVEIATVVFLGVGIGHRATVATASISATVARPERRKSQQSHRATVAQPATVAPTATVALLRPAATVAHNCEALAVQLLQRSATVPQDDIVQLFGGNKSRASRWLGRLEREGRVTRTSEGRSKLVALV